MAFFVLGAILVYGFYNLAIGFMGAMSYEGCPSCVGMFDRGAIIVIVSGIGFILSTILFIARMIRRKFQGKPLPPEGEKKKNTTHNRKYSDSTDVIVD